MQWRKGEPEALVEEVRGPPGSCKWESESHQTVRIGMCSLVISQHRGESGTQGRPS